MRQHLTFQFTVAMKRKQIAITRAHVLSKNLLAREASIFAKPLAREPIILARQTGPAHTEFTSPGPPKLAPGNRARG
jgi:hypothetical protein